MDKTEARMQNWLKSLLKPENAGWLSSVLSLCCLSWPKAQGMRLADVLKLDLDKL